MQATLLPNQLFIRGIATLYELRLFINFHRECRAAHAENSGRSFHLHGIRGTFRDLARDNCQGSTLHVGKKFAFVGGGIKTKLLELDPTIRSGREAGIINEGDPDTTIGSGCHHVRLFDQVTSLGALLYIVPKEKDLARDIFNLANFCPSRSFEQAAKPTSMTAITTERQSIILASSENLSNTFRRASNFATFGTKATRGRSAT
jgi:hypothetical protein